MCVTITGCCAKFHQLIRAYPPDYRAVQGKERGSCQGHSTLERDCRQTVEERDELKGLKSELAALERKIQLELSKDNEPKQEEQQAVANSDVTTDMNYRHLYLKLMYHCITYINQRIYARISQYASNKLCTFVYLFSWSNRLFVCF